MENDELKNHIESRRQEFEVYDFDKNVSWDNISNRLESKSTNYIQVPLKYIWRVAVVFILSLSFTFYIVWANYSQRGVDLISSAELEEADAYYGILISNRVLQLENRKSEVDQEIFSDIAALDLAFSELKEDLKDNMDNEEVVNAIILNYKIKLEILERILSELKIEDVSLSN